MSLEIDGVSHGGQLSDETLHWLFKQLKPDDIEQFYMAYQLWLQRQQIEYLQLQMLALQQRIADNAAHMERIQPSAIALSTLAQLQGYGVENLDLLDQMLDCGDEWLDHSLQLLERCEQLDLVGGDYTQWCEHALEGAYDWIDSIADANKTDSAGSGEAEAPEIALPIDGQSGYVEPGDKVTEDQLLKKLMSEEGDEDDVQNAEQPHTLQGPRITQPLPALAEQHALAPGEYDTPENDTKNAAIAKPVKLPRTTQPLTADALADVQDCTDNALLAANEDKQPLHPHDALPAVPHDANEDKQPLHIDDTLHSLQSDITEKMPVIRNSSPLSASRDIAVEAAEVSNQDPTPGDAVEDRIPDDTTKEIPVTSSALPLTANEAHTQKQDTDSSLSPPLAGIEEQDTNIQILAIIEDERTNKDEGVVLEETETADTNAQTIPTLMAQTVQTERTESRDADDSDKPDEPGDSDDAIAVHEAVVQHEQDDNAQVRASQPLETVRSHVDLEELRQKKQGQRKRQGFFRWLLAKIFRR